jgi:predicted RNase H-like HicB family nuclease
MAKFVYPAVFHPNDDGSITISFPDLPGCISEGKSLENALYMAQDALTQYLQVSSEAGLDFSPASDMSAVSCGAGEFVSLVRAETKDGRAVRRTVSIPKWIG